MHHKGFGFFLIVSGKNNRTGLINRFRGIDTSVEEIVPLAEEHTLHNTSLLSFGKVQH